MSRRSSFYDGHRASDEAPNRFAVDERDREEALDLFGSPAFVTAAQWNVGRYSNESPARAFLRVVLASGLHELAHFPPGHEAYEAAMAWLMEEDDLTNVCSFRALCDAFDLDYIRVRHLVLERLAAGTLRIPREAMSPEVRPRVHPPASREAA